MADRFPLILNTSANQIQEIASGDTLDLTGSNIKGVGIITAGNLSGNIIAGAGSSNIVAGVITATQIDLNGDIDVDGHTNLDNVNVGGATTTTGILNITANTTSTNTTSGALRVAGGVGIQGSVNIGESVNIDADLDVDGHTNLDNVNVVGVLTVTGAVNASHSNFGNLNTTGITIENTNASILFADTNNNPDYWAKADSGIFEIVQYNNGGSNIQAVKINTDGHIDIATNVDFASGIDVTGTITGTSHVDLPDAAQIKLGDNDEFLIYHTATGTSYIKETGSGDLYIDATNIRLRSQNGNNKLVTSSTGVDITGNATVSGNLSVGGVLTYEDVTNVDSVGLVTARTGVRVNSGGIKVTSGVSYFNANIVGTATTAISITATDESSDTTCNVLFATAATGNLAPKTGTNLTFNSSNGTLTATTFSGSGASLTSLPAANLTGTAAAINGSNITNVNAASVGGIAAGSFLRSDASDTFNCNGFHLGFDFDSSGRDSIIFLLSGTQKWGLVHDNGGNDINFTPYNSAGSIKISGNRILTTADEGSGNGLDADTVDGIQGSNILTLSGSQTIAGTKTFNCSGYDIQLDYDSTRTLVSILRSGTEKVRMHTSGDTILVETFNSGVILSLIHI